MNKSRNWWELATKVAVASWVVFCLRLMIADVWDETNGMLTFSGTAMTLLLIPILSMRQPAPGVPGAGGTPAATIAGMV